MASRSVQDILVILLAVLATGGVVFAINAEREKQQIAGAYQESLNVLIERTGQLTHDIISTRQSIQDMAGSQAKKVEELSKALEQTRSELSALQQKHNELQQAQTNTMEQ